ncbi:hypothetical protein ACQP2K_02415 [Microbispora siamensis]
MLRTAWSTLRTRWISFAGTFAALGLLAPVFVRPVTRLLVAPLERLRGAGGVVVAGGTAASARRTAATAEPVLVTVALAASLLGGAAMTDAAKSALRTRPVRADYLVLPDGDAGLDRQLVQRLRAIPGVDVATETETSVYTLEGDTQLIRRPAQAVEPGTLSTALSVPWSPDRRPGCATTRSSPGRGS